MRRLLALPVLVAAFALPAPAQAAESCTDTNPVGVCYSLGYCTDLCFIDPYVYGYCQHPAPPTVCAVVSFRVGGH